MSDTDLQRLRAAIEAHGWSLRETERRAGLPVATLSPLLSGKAKTLSLESWRRLAAALAVPLAELLGEAEAAPANAVRMVPLSALAPNPGNPRRAMDDAALLDLAHSIETHGILQNLVVAPHPEAPGRYLVIAGHRRCRALMRLVERGSWDEHAANVPVLVDDLSGTNLLAVALVENLQRAELSPLEEGDAFKQLLDLEWSTAEIAKAISRSQRFVQQRLSLTRGLCEDAKCALEAGEITIEEARDMALVTPDEQRRRLAGDEAPPLTVWPEHRQIDLEETIAAADEPDETCVAGSVPDRIFPTDPQPEPDDFDYPRTSTTHSLGDVPTATGVHLQPASAPPADRPLPLESPSSSTAAEREELERRLMRKVARDPTLAMRIWLYDAIIDFACTFPPDEDTEVWPITAEQAGAYLRKRGAVEVVAYGNCVALPNETKTSDSQQRLLDALWSLPAVDVHIWWAAWSAASGPWWGPKALARICEAVGVATRPAVTDEAPES